MTKAVASVSSCPSPRSGARRARSCDSAGRCAMSGRAADAGGASAATPFARILRDRAWPARRGCVALPTAGWRRPSRGRGGAVRRSRGGGRRSGATARSSTRRTRGDATRQPSRAGRSPTPIASLSTRAVVRPRTAGRTTEARAWDECAGIWPAAAGGRGSRARVFGARPRGR